MLKKLFFFFLSFLFAVSFSQKKPAQNYEALVAAYKKADNLYKEAERISLSSDYDEQKEEELNKASLQQFTILCNEFSANSPVYDSLLFHCYVKAGVLKHYFDSTSEAKKNYISALNLQKKLPALPDSFCFKPLIYLGGILYLENKFDSANTCYRDAEKIAANYPYRLAESERLINTLGALYFEAGNYSQAKNYFTKAINSVSLTGEAAKTLTANYKINLAATLTKLEDYENAGKIYEELLPYNINQNDILHNIGFIRYKTGKPQEALGYYRRVTYSSKSIIRLYNDISQVFLKLDNEDSAVYYLQLAIAENNKWNRNQKNLQHGLTLKYLGDIANQKRLYQEAISKYQQSVIQFTSGFNSADPYTNPEKFSGIFSYINLFNTLTAKADAFEKIYDQDNKTEALEAALNAYRSAFSLAGYVERTYSSDEARLFIGKIKHAVHSRPIDIGLKLYKLTKKKEYLEEVYFFDQRNKASILSLNMKLQEISAAERGTNQLYIREAVIKSDITRLSLKSGNIADSQQLVLINASIRDKEIELDKIREEINADPVRQQLLAAEKIPTVSQLQRQLDNVTGLLSFHLSDKELLILVITGNRFEYHQVVINQDFFKEIEAFKNSLYQASAEQRFSGGANATKLYQTLLSSVIPSLAQTKRLIIIPDDELNYLPFEALQDENKNYLIQKFSVQYQYSTALLEKRIHPKFPSAVLSFAPFATSGYKDSAVSLSSLPASSEEIQQLKGKNLMDTAATKSNFLQLANHYHIVHLATHASASNADPQRSYISFYPGNNESRLYAGEIYDMQLDSTSLIILSACETGAGQLVKGEGLMSLSRAFAYAGCPNIITSLWKAEDKATAYITQRLHYHLGKNETRDKALQMAKTDFLNSPEIDIRLKTPNYWAHLILIAEYEPYHKRSNWAAVAIGIVATLLIYYYIKKKNLPSSKKRQA